MKKSIIAIIVIVVIGLIIWAVTKKPAAPAAEKAPIKIGVIISETGVAASFGEMAHKGIALAAKEINAAGGIDGRKIEISYEDDRTDPKAAVGAYQKLTGIDHVDALIGSNFDFVTQPLFALAKAGDTVIASPSNPHVPITFETNEHSFVMMTEFDDIIRTFKSYLDKTHYEQLGILRFESSFAAQIEKTLNDMQIEAGKKPIVSETYKEIGNNDFKNQILKLKQAGVDLVFLDMIAIDPATFVKQAKALNYNPKIITHVGLKDALNMKEIDPKIFDGVVAIDWDVVTTDFLNKFKAEYNMNPDKSANRAYDAVYVLSRAVAQAKSKSEIPSILETTTFTTPNGQFSFNKNHAAASTTIALLVVKDGKLVPLAN